MKGVEAQPIAEIEPLPAWASPRKWDPPSTPRCGVAGHAFTHGWIGPHLARKLNSSPLFRRCRRPPSTSEASSCAYMGTPRQTRATTHFLHKGRWDQVNPRLYSFTYVKEANDCRIAGHHSSATPSPARWTSPLPTRRTQSLPSAGWRGTRLRWTTAWAALEALAPLRHGARPTASRHTHCAAQTVRVRFAHCIPKLGKCLLLPVYASRI